VLQGVAQECKSRIYKPFSILRFAACCTVLRSRWYQSGINRGINAERGYAQWCEEVEEFIYSAKEQRAEAS
jgi:hypothetical protein